MKVEVKLRNPHLTLFTLSVTIILILSAALAFNSGGPPSTMGHSVEELDLGPMSIDTNNERIGIRTTSPSTDLHVEGGARVTSLIACTAIETDAQGNLLCGTDDTGTSLWAQTGSDIYYNTGNVGIGTTAPSRALHVVGNARVTGLVACPSIESDSQGNLACGPLGLWAQTGSDIYYNSGNVGIGTTNPSSRLDVTGNAAIAGDLQVTGTVVATAYLGDGSGLTGIASGTGGLINTGSTTIGADSDSDGIGEIALQTRGTTRMTVVNSGAVGIGDNTPDSGTGGQLKLDVEGNIGAAQYCDENGDNCRSVTVTATLECTTVHVSGVAKASMPITANCPVDDPPYAVTGGGCRYHSIGGHSGGWYDAYVVGNGYRCTPTAYLDIDIHVYARCCRIV